MRHLRNAVHGDFQGNSDLLLDLLGGDPRPLGDDFDVIVGHVRIGVDGQIVECHIASAAQQKSQDKDQKAIVQREIDNLANHLSSPPLKCQPTGC